MDWVESLILGAVQGLTEFLPVSSDGHLATVQQFFARLRGNRRPAADDLFFDVMLHLGTLAAILIHYRGPVALGLRGLRGAAGVPEGYHRVEVRRLVALAVVATLPLVPDKLFLMDYIERAFQSPRATGVGFLITAAVLLLTMRLGGGEKGPRETTFRDALLVGVAQMLAPLPGISRSGLTIAAALALGFTRPWAVGFSLLMAVPAIVGAAASELKDADLGALTAGRLAQMVAATALAGLVGYFAITWLVRIVRGGRLWYFSVYLVALAGAVLATAGTAPAGGGPDGATAPAVDRAGPARPDGPGDPGVGGRGPGPADRADAPGPGPGGPAAGGAGD